MQGIALLYKRNAPYFHACVSLATIHRVVPCLQLLIVHRQLHVQLRRVPVCFHRAFVVPVQHVHCGHWRRIHKRLRVPGRVEW
jgi:hypothetical protein